MRPGRRWGAGRRAAAGLALAVASLTPSPAPGAAAPPSDSKAALLHARLESRLARLGDDLEGVAGYLIRDLTTGEGFERNADAVFPAASVIKLPILLDLYRRAEEGTIDPGRPVPIDPRQRVEGGGVLEKWSEPYPVLSAAQLAVLMMNFSDNYATNLLIDHLGMEGIARRMKSWGLRDTLLRRRMIDVEAARAGRENVATPRELAGLLEKLHRGRILDPDSTRLVLGIMKRNEATPFVLDLPPGVEAAQKEGSLEAVRCTAAIVYVPDRPFAIAVMTTFLASEAAGAAYIRAVSRAAADYFHALAVSSEYGRAIPR